MTDRPKATRLFQYDRWASPVRVAASALAGMIFCFRALAAEPEITLRDIRSIYARRAASVGSIHVWWEGSSTLLKGPSPHDNLTQSVDSESSGEAIIQGDSVWQRRTSGVLQVDKGVLAKGRARLTVATPSRGCRTYRRDGARGKISSMARSPITRSGTLACVLVGFVTATASKMIFDVPNIEILRREEREEGTVVVIGNTDYNDTRRQGATRWEWILSPALAYQMIENVEMLPDGGVVCRRRISYEEVPEFGHVPRSVRIITSTLANPELLRSVTSLTFRMRFNETVDPAVFDFTFPPGTRIFDAQLKINYVVGPTDALDDAGRRAR